jgi:Tfp pilus assembly protein PilN
MAKDTTTGILVTPDVVEWAALRRSKGAIQIVDEGRVDRDEGDPSGVASSLAAIKSPVVLSLSSTQLLLRVMELPSVDDEELAGMVELQVDKFSPFPVDQMVVSHEVLTRGESKCTVVVAVARQQTVDDAGSVLNEQGIRISRVDAALLSRWKSMSDSGQLTRDGRETLVVVSDDTVEVLTHESGRLIGLSCLGRVGDLEDAQIAAEIAKEVAHVVVAIEVERGRAGSHQITLWSDSETTAPFAQALRQACEGDVKEQPLGILPSTVQGTAARALTGGALIDLTPQSWRAAKSSKRFRRQMLGSAVAVLAVWGLLVGGGLGWLAFEQARLDALNGEADRLLAPANEVRRLRLQVNMIERYTNHTYSALECLREISQVLPEGADLTSFTYRKGEGVDIGGEADSGRLVSAFNEALNRSALFSEVRPGTRTLTKKGRHRFGFDIKFPEATK